MELKVRVIQVNEKKEPVNKTLSFPCTESQKIALEEIKRDHKNIDINKSLRDCIDQIIKLCKTKD